MVIFLRKIFNIFIKFLFAPFLLYFYNLIAVNYDLLVPINIGSIIIVGLFGLPGLLFLVISLFVI